MNPREDVDGLSWQFANRVVVMIESGLVTHREYVPWAESLIVKMDEPPIWIIDLALKEDSREAVEVLNQYVNSAPGEVSTMVERTDDYVACMFLRYKRGDVSWATFLSVAGDITDAYKGREKCAYFYDMLNAVKADDSKALTESQEKNVLDRYADVIASVTDTYDRLKVS